VAWPEAVRRVDWTNFFRQELRLIRGVVSLNNINARSAHFASASATTTYMEARVTLQGSQIVPLTTLFDVAESTAKPLPGAVMKIIRAYLPLDLFVGSRVAARDPLGCWYLATVLKITPDRLMVHFHGWSDLYDASYTHNSGHLMHLSCVWRFWRLAPGKRWSQEKKELMAEAEASDANVVVLCEQRRQTCEPSVPSSGSARAGAGASVHFTSTLAGEKS
jgi:hypothetical protein